MPPRGSGAPPPREGYPQEQPPPAEFGYFSVRTEVESQAHRIADRDGSETVVEILKRLAPVHFNEFERLPYWVEVVSPSSTGVQPQMGVCGRCRPTNSNIGRTRGRTYDVAVHGDHTHVPEKNQSGGKPHARVRTVP